MAKLPPPQTEASKATRFQKGNAGPNKAGRPRKLPNLDRLLLEVLGDEDDKNSVIKQILSSAAKRAKKGDNRAAEILMDRAYGKQPSERPIVVDNKLEIKVTYE